MKQNVLNLCDRFDAAGFCEKGGSWAGEIAPALLERVQDFAEIESPFTATLAGSRNTHSQRCIDMTSHGQLTLMCERCARDFLFEINTASKIWIANAEAEIQSIESTISEEHDLVLASEVVSAIQLLEDEVLLAIPYSPRCEKPDCEVVKI